MKISLIMAALILVIGFSLGWRDYQRQAAARTLHQVLSKKLGLSLDGRSHVTAFTRRERRGPDVRAKAVMAEFLGYKREYARQAAAGEVSKDLLKDFATLMEHVKALNSDELRVLIQELRANQEISGWDPWHFIISIIDSLPETRPALALELCVATTDLAPRDSPWNLNLINEAIQNLAKYDPESALKWLKENDSNLSEYETEQRKERLLSGVASRNPVLAFQMLGKLGMDNPTDRGLDRISNACKTPESRMAAVAGIREYVATLPEKKREEIQNEAVSWLGYEAAIESFESGSKWIAAANLTEGELNRFAFNLGSNIINVKEGDAGKWLQWASSTLPASKVNETVGNMVQSWAREDYLAAANWIKSNPAGPLKNASTRAYAEAVSRYEPDSAVDWAATLPAGAERDATFKTIYTNWLEKDAAAAAAFAKRYGIK